MTTSEMGHDLVPEVQSKTGTPEAAVQPEAAPRRKAVSAPSRFSPKLVQMLLGLTPEQRDEAASIVGKLLAAKAHRMAKKG